MSEDRKEARIVDARMRLRERHLAKVQTPGFADAPMGSGPANRHGMPKLPPGFDKFGR